MKKTRAGLIVALAVLACAALPRAQFVPAAQGPPRDTAIPAQTGTAVIAGRIVVNGEPDQPVRRAILLLNGGGIVMARQTTTDIDGRFAFSALPGGRYTLTAWRSGFVRDLYGNKRPGIGTGSPIVVADGAQATITMKLTRAAAINGSIIGLPSAAGGVRVILMQNRLVDGERRLVPANVGGVSPMGGVGGMPDDRGAYRMYGLPPGEYVIGTSSFFSFSPDGMGTRVMTAEEVRWALQQFGPRPPGGPPPPDPPPSRSIGYAPVYFPGTTDPTSATTVTLGAGEERSGMDFSLPLVPLSTIEGVVLDPSGRPPAAMQVMLRPASELLAMMGGSGSVKTTADGKFSVSSVMPGRYVVTARGSVRLAAPPTGAAPVPAGRGGQPTGTSLWASTELEIDGRDVGNVLLSLQPGAAVSGRVVLDGAELSTLQVRPRLMLRSTGGNTLSVESLSAMAAADGTFTIAGVPPGRYRLAPLSLMPPWTPASAKIGDRDWLDETIDIRGSDTIGEVVVTMTSRAAGLAGVVQDATGRPTSEFFVVVFPTERRYWGSQSRRVAQSRPDSTGGFTISTLPPGDYYVAALTDVDTDQFADPAFLESLISASIKLTLVAGEVKTQNLRIAGGER